MAKDKDAENKQSGRGTGHKGRAQGSHTWEDREMQGKSELTAKGAKERGKSMDYNLSAKERAKRDKK